ncbi:MAG: extra-cytoplasmic solute receptor [Rubritepida sp.]|nr:extra-cytoplasmic solute receptor [Rubritepida sp.]
MKTTRRQILPLLAAGAGLGMPGIAWAADAYPARPVRIIAPFPPGGAVDAVARKIAQKLTEQVGQQFFVENKTGATGTIGMAEAARAAPDGLTLLAIDSTYSMVPYVFRRLAWDHANGFSAITDSARGRTVLVVRANLPLRTYQDFIEHARQNPEKLTYGSGGIGSVLHFYAEGLQQAAGVKFFHVPYRGAGDAMIGMLSGQVDFAVAPTAATIEHVRGGTMRALAVTGTTRSTYLPDVPTFGEVGQPQFSPVYWTGLAAPARTPQEVIDRLRTEVVRAMDAPDMKEFLASQVAEPGGVSSDDFATLIREETERWRVVAAQAHIEQQ